ncbi:MAG: DUF6468 domain-containing protein [Alphaproteobacteria bacterium]|jgi:hypothetical protein|nr:DUF6468 domain-containing protein [Alphaproteobacteria bacterium]
MMELPLHTELWLDGLVAILLLVTVVYCLVLNHRLTALRGNQGEMRKLLADFTAATQAAETSVNHLKMASDHAGAALDQKITDARALADELSSITQSGGRLAERIESGLVNRPLPGQPGAAGRGAEIRNSGRAAEKAPKLPQETEELPGKLSESERELAEILRQARS